jgi:hypothetical protein
LSGLTKTLAIGATLLGLGGLAGFAVNSGHGNVSTAQKSPPVEVRTQVITHTVRIHRKAKAPKQPPRPVAAPPVPSRAPVVAAAPPLPPVASPQVAPRIVVPVRHKPVLTRTSGASGRHGGERDDNAKHDD